MTGRSAGPRDRVLRYLGSYEQLHLLVVVADEPGRRWTAGDLAAHGVADAEEAAGLVAAGVLARWADGALSLSADPEVADSARALVREYHEDPLPIVRQLTEGAMGRLRSVTARSFADAFVVRRKDP